MFIRKPAAADKAFSLAELLVVITIIVMMGALGLPAFSSLNKASGINRAVSGLSLSFEQARAYAMAQNTYVQVGFNSDPNTDQVVCATLASAGGQVSDFLTPSSCRMPARPQKFDNIKILNDADIPPLPGMATNADGIAATEMDRFSVDFGGKNMTFSNVVRFNPLGEATLKTNSISRWIQVAIAPAHSSQSNYAVIQISGLAGQVSVFRPQ